MLKGSFKAKTKSGRIVTVKVMRESVPVDARAGRKAIPGMIELFCPDLNSPVNVDIDDETRTHFTLVFPQMDLYRLPDSPFPEV